MKSVAICISNWNNFEAIELCVESVRKFTDYPAHRVIAYDDFSTVGGPTGERVRNEHDLSYLRACRDKGWIELIEGTANVYHGGALNVLLNERCRDEFDYAVPLDGDVQIRGTGWLQALLADCRKSPDILGVCYRKGKGFWPAGYALESYLYCIGLIDLALYRDIGRVDWSIESMDRRQEPYLSYFAELYPPERNANFHLCMTEPCYKNFDRDKVIFDPGNTIADKLLFENPKGYRIVPWPAGFERLWTHHVHSSAWMDPANIAVGGKSRDMHYLRRSVVIQELEKLRRG